jgi:phosphomannomutase
MLDTLYELSQKENLDLGFVGGSDLHKQHEQIGKENMDLFTWKFTENGLLSYSKNHLINKTSILEYLGEDNYQELINICLREISHTRIPQKRGQFIELRNGMINISPIGRSCSQSEREAFYEYDKIHKVRETLIDKIQSKTSALGMDLNFSIGGQISIDVFPKGWDKTYCLQFVEHLYDTIYFFGDKTLPGGNDYEIYRDPRVKGVSVNHYSETLSFLQEHFIHSAL